MAWYRRGCLLLTDVVRVQTTGKYCIEGRQTRFAASHRGSDMQQHDERQHTESKYVNRRKAESQFAFAKATRGRR